MAEHPQSHKFFSMYANIPIPLRREICCVVDDEPLAFHIVYLELKNKTEFGYKALEQLIRLEIIK